jgi:hypothetical protein
MKEICDYWKDRALKPAIERCLGPEKMKEIYEMCDRGSWVYSFFQEIEGDKSWRSELPIFFIHYFWLSSPFVINLSHLFVHFSILYSNIHMIARSTPLALTGLRHDKQ